MSAPFSVVPVNQSMHIATFQPLRMTPIRVVVVLVSSESSQTVVDIQVCNNLGVVSQQCPWVGPSTLSVLTVLNEVEWSSSSLFYAALSFSQQAVSVGSSRFLEPVIASDHMWNGDSGLIIHRKNYLRALSAPQPLRAYGLEHSRACLDVIYESTGDKLVCQPWEMHGFRCLAWSNGPAQHRFVRKLHFPRPPTALVMPDRRCRPSIRSDVLC